MRTLQPLVLFLVLALPACTNDPDETDSDPPVHTDDTDGIVGDSCEVCHASEDALKANVEEDTDGEPVDEGES